MKKWPGLVVCLVVFWAVSAQSASLPYEATLLVRVGSFPSFTFPGSGVGTSSGGPGSDASTAAGLPVGSLATLPEPLAGAIKGFGLCEPGLPSAFPSGQVFVMPSVGASVPNCNPVSGGVLDAVSYVGATGEATGALDASAYLILTDDSSAGEIPLSVIGIGGTEIFAIPSFGVTNGSITGNPWTTGSVSVTYKLATDPVPQTLSAMGSDERNADGTGRLTLVTSALANLGPLLGSVGAVSELQITYVPEPGTPALIGLGLMGLAAAGRRRA